MFLEFEQGSTVCTPSLHVPYDSTRSGTMSHVSFDEFFWCNDVWFIVSSLLNFWFNEFLVYYSGLFHFWFLVLVYSFLVLVWFISFLVFHFLVCVMTCVIKCDCGMCEKEENK